MKEINLHTEGNVMDNEITFDIILNGVMTLPTKLNRAHSLVILSHLFTCLKDEYRILRKVLELKETNTSDLNRRQTKLIPNAN